MLHAEEVSLKVIAEDIGTPFYCYSTATLERHYRVFDEAFKGIDHTICYSMKANSNQAVVKTLADLGAGIDVVSEGELRRALALGVPGRKIVFSGVGKTAREMALGLKEGIACFNVESEPELELLSSVATRIGTARHRFHPHQSRCRCQDPCQDHHRQGREQVRHFLFARAAKSMPGPPRSPASMWPASTCISAARSPSSSPSSRLSG